MYLGAEFGIRHHNQFGKINSVNFTATRTIDRTQTIDRKNN